MINENRNKKYYWKTALIFIGLYLVGMLMHYPVLLSQAEIYIGILGESFTSTPTEFALVALIQPFLLGIVLIYFGTRYFPYAQLRSLISERVEKDLPTYERQKYTLKESVPAIVTVSVIVAILLLGFDVVFQNWLPEFYQPNFGIASGAEVASQLFYNGMGREILLRFGVMSALVYVLGGRGSNLTQFTYVLSIVFTSLLYAFAQYSSILSSDEMSFVILLRILLLNGLVAILYGSLYYKFHIEAAMLSHMLANLLVILGNIIVVVLLG